MRVCTYNVLASAFVRPDFFPRSLPQHTATAYRYPLVAERLAECGADIICLQEVDADLWATLEARLRPLGYAGTWRPRHADKPDGCALLWRESDFAVEVEHVRFAELDETRPAKRAAVIGSFRRRHDGATFSAACVHLAWEPDGTPADRHAGLHQAEQLLARLPTDRPLLVTGDFNAEPGHALLCRFANVGFADAHAPDARTNVANGRALKVDHVLTAGPIAARPVAPALALRDDTPLPSEDEPSDHLMLTADLFLA